MDHGSGTAVGTHDDDPRADQRDRLRARCVRHLDRRNLEPGGLHDRHTGVGGCSRHRPTGELVGSVGSVGSIGSVRWPRNPARHWLRAGFPWSPRPACCWPEASCSFSSLGGEGDSHQVEQMSGRRPAGTSTNARWRCRPSPEEDDHRPAHPSRYMVSLAHVESDRSPSDRARRLRLSRHLRRPGNLAG